METAGGAGTIAEVIDARPLTPFQVTTLALCTMVLVLDGLATQSIGFLAPAMAQSLHLPLGSFGPVFSSALLGLMLSSMVAGPIADRVGRKVPIVVATLMFGTFTIVTAQAASFDQLVTFRFLTGLGLGAAIPNAVSLVAEYAPKRLQHTLVTMLFCGMPAGALLGGVIGALLLPRWGWRTVFCVSGILPLVASPLLILVLPESLRFLSTKETNPRAVQRILRRLGAPETRLEPPAVHHPGASGVPVVDLFTEGRSMGTLLLWIAFFMSLLLLYFIVNWLPALLRQTQMPASVGPAAIAMFSLGGIFGSLFQGMAMQAWGGRRVMLMEFLLTIGVVWSLASIPSFPLLMAMVFIGGCLLQGAQAGINASAATYYPTRMRATGVGWALGVGRSGSVIGPVLGGLMIAHAWQVRSIFYIGGLPALLAAASILLSAGLKQERNPYAL